MADERSAVEIERDLAQARARLAANLTQLVTEVHPKAVVHRSVVNTKQQAHHAIDRGKKRLEDSYTQVKRYFKDEAGWNLKNLAIAAGVTVLVVTVVVARKKK